MHETCLVTVHTLGRDGRVIKYTNKIYSDNHIHYTSLHLLFE